MSHHPDGGVSLITIVHQYAPCEYSRSANSCPAMDGYILTFIQCVMQCIDQLPECLFIQRQLFVRDREVDKINTGLLA